MSNVGLMVGGRTYRIACADGQEAHVAELGRIVDSAVSASGGSRANNEPQMLLFAALMLADELHEARRALSEAPAAPPQELPQIEDRITMIAERLEAFAERLEERAANA